MPLGTLCRCCWRGLGTLQGVILGWPGDTGSVLVGGWGHWWKVLEGALETQGGVTGAGI